MNDIMIDDGADDLPGIQSRSAVSSLDNKDKQPTGEAGEGSAEADSFVLYRYRFFELTLYCLAIMMNMVCWMSLQPIVTALQNAYGVSSAVIGSMGFMFMLVFIPVNFPSNWVLERYGLRVGILVGIAFSTLGMWVKCLINVSFVWAWVG